MSTRIHPSACVEKGAELDAGVVVGPFCFVGRGVRIAAGTELLAHASVLGPTTLGRNNRVFPYATLGAEPQDKSFKGEPTELLVGDDNVFREQVTLHRGTLKGGGQTRVGDRCLLMVGSHVAHDCSLGNDIVLTNLTTLGGHVIVDHNAVCGGHVAVAPFVRLGRACFVAGGARVERDVPPFLIAQGDRARVRAVNRVGLERIGAPMASQRELAKAFQRLFRGREPIAVALASLEAESTDVMVVELLDFLKTRLPRIALVKRQSA